MQLISVTCFVSHFDISGNDINEEHPKNKPLISFIFEVFHSDISGKDFNALQPAKMKEIFSFISSFLFSFFSFKEESEFLFELELFMLEIVPRLFNNKEFDFSALINITF